MMHCISFSRIENITKRRWGEKEGPIMYQVCTGKSLSEALIFASTNPQYDSRFFIVYENCKLRIPAEHGENMLCT